MAARSHHPAQPAGNGSFSWPLGGAPLPQSTTGVPDDKQVRKQLKRELRLRRDAERPPDSFERWRILSELVNEGRRVVEIADHKARNALAIIGILNAGVYFVMSRAHLFDNMLPAAKPWMISFLVVYAALTFLFVWYAVDCVRPRQLHYAEHIQRTAERREGTPPHGLLYWEAIAAHDLESYQRAWSGARMEELNAEVVVIAHHLARLIQLKYVALGRLYVGLAVLIALAGALLAFFALFGIFL